MALATALGAGCGGSGGDATGTTSAAPVSKGEFVRLANAACREERAGLPERVTEYERRLEGRTPAPGSDLVHLVYLTTMANQTERLRELEIPPGEEEAVEEMIDTEQRAIDKVFVKPRVPSIAVAERTFARADHRFHAYGIDACATDTGPR